MIVDAGKVLNGALGGLECTCLLQLQHCHGKRAGGNLERLAIDASLEEFEPLLQVAVRAPDLSAQEEVRLAVLRIGRLADVAEDCQSLLVLPVAERELADLHQEAEADNFVGDLARSLPASHQNVEGHLVLSLPQVVVSEVVDLAKIVGVLHHSVLVCHRDVRDAGDLHALDLGAPSEHLHDIDDRLVAHPLETRHIDGQLLPRFIFLLRCRWRRLDLCLGCHQRHGRQASGPKGSRRAARGLTSR
mmetsp:Transcript_113784/g.361621  ORF Transcript_113784/g.361621 Transcript_113784/m.361621 type:complete len:246 (+) Transcript_113784:237-974(+)